MEEVWKDINLTTLHERPMTPPIIPIGPRFHHHRTSILPSTTNSTTTSQSFRGIILQDFLAGAFKEPTPLPPPPPPPPPPPLPPTILSLNSGLDSHHRDGSNPDNGSLLYSQAFSDAAMDSGSFSFSLCPQRRSSDVPPGDRRHKRMIKNRESAARSRARKQAYTNELELEVAQLVEENAKLRRQHEELRTAMAAQQSRKRTLQRTSTAPF
ncbi:hypothetical protein J5N97_022757 [Dioscorea zingiberensis]|uniref:BZIP domain-containing protein n=1 Tax=Dioscorea zingiberensis TaxID=325984 RepID=A0A9D5CCL8_9LILI|nr:hypothetical protein J5N97_022757 [Dioscorea zingiberensis]